MRRWIVALVPVAVVACGHAGPTPPAPAPERSGCLVLGPDATAAPFAFPDTLELAAEWFLPDDSTGGRLRVVRPRDASLATYRAYGGRFWWTTTPDSILVTRSDGQSGAVLSLRPDGETLAGTMRTFGPTDAGRREPTSARRISCRAPSS
ncbi:MAG: hypothetical protein Q8W45_10955 [Candidatus Palauibacterales bacterium]|nr:hypothetical protein [Candidatus Palauibacterales bacterium]